MHLPTAQRVLLKRVSLIGFGLLVIATSKLSTLATTPAKPVSASEIANSDKYLENVSVIATIKGRRPARGNNGVILDLEGEGGYEFLAYVSPDVKNVPLRAGLRVEVVGSTIGQGAISVTKPDGLKVLKVGAQSRKVDGVEIRNGVAYWQAGGTVVSLPTDIPSGYYSSLTLVSDAYGKCVLETHMYH